MTIAIPPSRLNNAERRRGRDECREKLAQHIHHRLGVKIKPSEVRLNPRVTESYSWRVVHGKEDMFSKIFARSLSDHSIGTFRLLCREVGKSFEAVVPHAQVSTLDTIMPVSSEQVSFSAIIEQLQDENASLRKQIQEATTKADAECERRKVAEEENYQLHGKQVWLEKQVQEQTDVAGSFQGIVAKCAADIEKAWPALEGLKKHALEGRFAGHVPQ